MGLGWVLFLRGDSGREAFSFPFLSFTFFFSRVDTNLISEAAAGAAWTCSYRRYLHFYQGFQVIFVSVPRHSRRDLDLRLLDGQSMMSRSWCVPRMGKH